MMYKKYLLVFSQLAGPNPQSGYVSEELVEHLNDQIRVSLN